MKETLKDTAGFLRPYYKGLTISLILSIVGAVLTVLTPSFLSRITTGIQQGLTGQMDKELIDHNMNLAIFALIIGFLLSYVQGLVMNKIGYQLAKELRQSLNHKLEKLPLSYFDQTPFGDTLSRVTNDVDTYTTTISNNISGLLTNLVTFIGCLIMMLLTSFPLSLATISSTLLGMGLSFWLIKKSSPEFQKQQDSLGLINGQIEEAFTGHLVIKTFNSEQQVKQTFQTSNEKLYQSAWKSQFYSSIMQPVMNLSGNVGYVVVCIYGAFLAFRGQLTMGDIVAFLLYVRLFSNSMAALMQSGATIQPALAAANRIFDLLDQEEMVMTSQGRVVEQPAGQVTFNHVQFGYVPGQTIIGDFSARIEPGQKIAIVGPTGAGKSTLVNLLMRFYELNGGHIAIDGVQIDQMSRTDLHQLLGMVLQDTWTFEGTLRENIVYATENVSEAYLNEVIEEVGLRHLVDSLPDGLDTVLGESTSLSAGQKQLVTIARAMVKNAPILILDEATSSIDTRTEKIIQQAIDTVTTGRTSFVIAHRLSTIKNADVIFVMKDGDIVEVGNHDELMHQDGFYRELYNSQFDQSA